MKGKKATRNYKRPVLGDIVEIAVPGGFAYAQYVNRHRQPPHFGPFIRVFRGTFVSRPRDFVALVNTKEQFSAFYPLGVAVSQGFVQIVAHEDVPEDFREFPVFKGCNQDFHTGKKTWFLSRLSPQGIKYERLGDLPTKYRDYPLKTLISHKGLVDRIVTGWTPADEV